MSRYNKLLNDISSIHITFENESELKDLCLCYKYTNIISPDKKNKLEKYLIMKTTFQMRFLKKCKQIHIDGTFKSCLKKLLPNS